jgi:hypothetical protein
MTRSEFESIGFAIAKGFKDGIREVQKVSDGITPEEQILICAVRYALGRMSYIVKDVCDYVKLKANELSEECKSIMIHDIYDDISYHHRIGRTVGFECDEREWIDLLELLKNEKRNIHDGKP